MVKRHLFAVGIRIGDENKLLPLAALLRQLSTIVTTVGILRLRRQNLVSTKHVSRKTKAKSDHIENPILAYDMRSQSQYLEKCVVDDKSDPRDDELSIHAHKYINA